MKYQSNYEGKARYTKDCLEPLFIGMGNGWTSVDYIVEGSQENILLTNANPDKTISVNVSHDSILALANDVMRAYLNEVSY